MLQDAHLRRNDIELFAGVFADAREPAAAGTGLLLLGQIVLDTHPREVVRQRLAPAALARMGGDGHRHNGLFLGRILRCGFRLVEQTELIGGVLLAGGAVALGQEQVELLAQARKLGFVFLGLGNDKLLQDIDVIRQFGGAESAGRHGEMLA